LATKISLLLNRHLNNLFVLLVDDAGYADFGFMGSKDLHTPNLDQLASNGMIFTDAHVSATVCAPSRAGLLTGQYQQRFGFECNALTHFEGIDTSEATIAEVLQQAGYETAAFGKWHVGDIPEARPNSRGFSYSWTFLSGARSYFSNEKEDREGHIKSIRENDQFTTFEGYLTDQLGEKAVDFIERNKKSPFFIYWSPNAVHTPMEATEDDLMRFEGHPRQKLAAMTWALDRAVGKIKEKLEEENLLDNTLIFFLSDNGGAHNNQSSNLPLKGFKGNKFEGGHRIAFFAHWPNRIASGQVFDGLTSTLDIFATAADVSTVELSDIKTDGVSLLPYFTGEKKGNPHQHLFWRKEGMAAARDGSSKIIRVDSLGYRLYDLDTDLGESNDLSTIDSLKLKDMQNQLSQWEEGLIDPLWVESVQWNKVTWWIHHDLYHNQKVRVSNPSQLKKLSLHAPQSK
ncbi:MAG: sulfatase-like hydrolase/transferase, partial [Bacteroidota bacterium]